MPAPDTVAAMPSNQEMAKSRTDWAEDRTVLANERTFAGWMRTGMAAVGIALGLRAVFGDFEPTWLAKAAASVFIVVAVLIFWAARQNSVVTQKRMTEHQIESQSVQRMTLLATILSFGALATGAILWLL